MTSWVLEALGPEKVEATNTEVARLLLDRALNLADGVITPETVAEITFVADTFELAVLDLLDNNTSVESSEVDSESSSSPDNIVTRLRQMRKTSSAAFQFFRVLPRPDDPLEAAKHSLHLGALGILGERGADVARHL